ncbi:MAG: hypothetical protein HY901_25695, partial [Deltaproteobacteria bacterium]|nr:hypothetical protein [Deltaproteobacteria bacterium]
MSPVQGASHIQLMLKPDLRDVLGLSVEESARRQLGIETGRVRSAKLVVLTLPLDAAQLEAFAARGLADPVLHDVYVNRLFADPRFQSYLLLARLPGVTDDEGASAQRTLTDLMASLPSPNRMGSGLPMPSPNRNGSGLPMPNPNGIRSGLPAAEAAPEVA